MRQGLRLLGDDATALGELALQAVDLADEPARLARRADLLRPL